MVANIMFPQLTVHDCQHTGNISSRVSINSEANASEFLENLEEKGH